MDFNELSYLETQGSLPSYFPELRYFHAKTQTPMDYENIGVKDLALFMEFLETMYHKYQGPRKGKTKASWKLKDKTDL